MAFMNFETNTNFQRLHGVNSSIAFFADLTNLPNVLGAIDGSHVRMRAPTALESPPDYVVGYQQMQYPFSKS